MKKLLLLCTIICAAQMYGMEPMEPGSLQTLPPELTFHIIKAGNLDEAIKNIVRLSRVNKELNDMLNYNDLQGFTQIVHVLANKFNMDPEDIAKQFKTPVAETYSNLYKKLYYLVTSEQDITKVKDLLDEGNVDINAGPILWVATLRPFRSPKLLATEMIQLLLEYGANPYATSQSQTALDRLNTKKPLYKQTDVNKADFEQAKAILEKAMQEKKYKRRK